MQRGKVKELLKTARVMQWVNKKNKQGEEGKWSTDITRNKPEDRERESKRIKARQTDYWL